LTHAALLTPVPELLLQRSEAVLAAHEQVAFGSRAWEVFRKLDVLRVESPVVGYLYASHPETPVGQKVTWTGLYIGHVDSLGGTYPGDPSLRPLVLADDEDDSGYWAVFWHLSDLVKLSPEEWIDIGNLRNFKTQNRYGAGFVPEGPTIVGHP